MLMETAWHMCNSSRQAACPHLVSSTQQLLEEHSRKMGRCSPCAQVSLPGHHVTSSLGSGEALQPACQLSRPLSVWFPCPA